MAISKQEKKRRCKSRISRTGVQGAGRFFAPGICLHVDEHCARVCLKYDYLRTNKKYSGTLLQGLSGHKLFCSCPLKPQSMLFADSLCLAFISQVIWGRKKSSIWACKVFFPKLFVNCSLRPMRELRVVTSSTQEILAKFRSGDSRERAGKSLCVAKTSLSWKQHSPRRILFLRPASLSFCFYNRGI